jgi:hypothetical protein
MARTVQQPKRRSNSADLGVLLCQRLLLSDGVPIELGVRS